MMVILSGIFAILFFTWWAGITIILTYTLGWVFFIVALILISDYRSERQLKKEKDVIENGFEYVTEMDGLKLFRKRK